MLELIALIVSVVVLAVVLVLNARTNHRLREIDRLRKEGR